VVHRTVDSIRQPPVNVKGDLTRRLFNLSSNGRLDLWSSAINDFRKHPILGSGAGTYEQWWLRHRQLGMKVRDAHNLYVEQLAELGSVGLFLLVVAFATPLVAAWRSRAQPLIPVACGAFVAFAAHAAVDWDWEMPAVTLCGLAFAAVLLLARKPESYRVVSPAPKRVVAVAMLLVASAFAFVTMNGNRALGQARGAASNDNPAAAARHARTAARWTPWSSEALSIQADSALEQGNLARARRLYQKALAKDGRNWELWLGLALATSGKPQDRAFARAAQLDPLAPEIAQLKTTGV
jgi:O-antigen ligase